MPNKKINELTPRTPTLTDLIIVGDPSSGYSFKATLSVISTFVGNNIQFSSLGGISLTSPTNGQVLTYNGTNWVNQTLSVPVQSVFGRTGAVVAAEGDYNLGQLGDVTITTPTSGQVLKYNGTAWVNDSDTDTGIVSLNGLTATTQTFATGTSGTDFTISSTTSTHTFNLPTASATNTGKLSSTDWSTFNAKQSAITLTTTGSSGASTLVGATLNIPTYTLAGLGGVSGSGTTNYVSKWTGSTALGNSQIFDNGTSVGINTSTPNATNKLEVNGNAAITGGGLQVLGGLTSPIGSGGFELEYSGGIAYVTSYNRSTSQWVPLYLRGSQIRFGVLGIETMRLTNNGRLLIGTTTESTFELDVVGDIRSTLDANINGLTVGKGGGSVSDNTAVGVSALFANTTGPANTGIGSEAGRRITTGSENTIIGTRAAAYIATSDFNTIIGSYAGYVTTGSGNTYVGRYSGVNATTGGSNAGLGNGSLSGLTTGSNNIGLGTSSGTSITEGTYNIVLGRSSTGITTGSFNTIIGQQITGLSSSLSNTIILADGQGNQRLRIEGGASAGLFTSTPSTYLAGVVGLSIFNGTSAGFSLATSSTNYTLAYLSSGGLYSWYSGTVGGRVGTIFNATGNWLLGSGTTDAGYKLDVNGTARTTGSTYLATTSGQVSIGTTSPIAGWTLFNGGNFRQEGNMYVVGTLQAGTISQPGGPMTINIISSLSRNITFVDGSGSTNGDYVRFFSTNTIGNITSGNANLLLVNPTINQTTGAGTIYGFRFNPTNTAIVSKVYAFHSSSGNVNFSGLPTSSSGLATGDLWNDGGTLKIA